MRLIEENGLRWLVPDEDKILTNGAAYAQQEVYLGCNEKQDNWYEITKAAYEEILQKQEDELNENFEG